MGLAACEANETMFTGPELYGSLMGIEFVGASGPVSFHKNNGFRDIRTAEYVIGNAVTKNATQVYLEKSLLTAAAAANNNQNDTNGTTFWFNNTGGNFAAFWVKRLVIQPSTGKIYLLNESDPLVLPTGATVPPKPFFKPIDLVSDDMNRLCWFLSFFVLLFSGCFAGWTIWNRRDVTVKVAQLIFLVLVCLGTTLVGISIIFIPFQENIVFNDQALGRYCMAQVWLSSLGYALVFAALYVKVWRFNAVFRVATKSSVTAFRKPTIRPHHLIVPMFTILGLNVIILLAWTIAAPIKWERPIYVNG